MTSRFEGYPLASLESMSHGCPVISYDIKYGPREQITDGVDGYLVEPGDLQGMADRIVADDPRPWAGRQMSKAALDKAEQHDHRAFLRDWRSVIEAVVEQKASRVRFEGVRPRRHAASGSPGPARLPRRFVAPRSWSTSSRTAPGSSSTRACTCVARPSPGPWPTWSSAWTPSATARAVSSRSRSTVDHRQRTFDVRALIDLGGVFAGLDAEDRALRLRLRAVWNNASWETTLARPEGGAPPFELSYAADGTLTMMRGT